MNSDKSPEQLVFDLNHKTSHALADFIVTQANTLAFDHINNWARWPGPLTLISGPAKSGKTHLARIWCELSGGRVCEAGEVEGLAQAGGTDGIVLDDVERSGIDERALFHLLNQSMRDNRPVLMTARTPVAEWDFSSDDVKSRARLAAHFSVLASDDLALCQMFAKLFDDRQVVVDPAIISYLVARMERSPSEVFELADALDKLALKRGKPISRSVAAEALAARAEQKQTEPEF
ncbi:MAG TPA: hypothetical protein ENK61_07620 [Devosia sp.]|nr:hypothetical protein [Devosia sp.]